MSPSSPDNNGNNKHFSVLVRDALGVIGLFGLNDGLPTVVHHLAKQSNNPEGITHQDTKLYIIA